MDNFEEFKQDINKACRFGYLSVLTNFLGTHKNHSKYKLIEQHAITKGFEQAAYHGKCDIVEYLLTSSELNSHADIHHNNDYAIRLSCYGGHIDTVKFLLTSPLLKEKSDPLANHGEPFRWAAESNHLPVVKFLMENDFNINPHYISPVTGSCAFMQACDQNALDCVKYISTLPKFNLNTSVCSINGDGKDGFQLACENHENDFDIVKFLILNLGFKPNKLQQQYIDANLDSEIVYQAANLLSTIDFYTKLDNDIQVSQPYKKTKKI